MRERERGIEEEKWTRLITEWYPRDSRSSKGRPDTRWEDDFKKIAGPEWTRVAKNKIKWKALGEAFVEGQAEKGVKYEN